MKLSETVNKQLNRNYEECNDIQKELTDLFGKHQKLKNAFDHHKSQYENLNRHNSENHEKIECSLQMLTESKQSMAKDMDHLKMDMKLTEDLRKNQEKIQNDRNRDDTGFQRFL